MTIRIGDRVADLTFLHPNGDSVQLSSFSTPMLLVFLRHLR
jgi:hypothetical protein